eukprot:scaffold97554_cov37-Prasinocladus_malaysianus.AAC.1
MHAGPEIDKADIVIRFNGGPVRGFERYVGTKTTYRLTNSDHFGFYDIGDETILQHVTNVDNTAFTTKLAKSVLRSRLAGETHTMDSVRFRIIDPEFHYRMMNLFTYGAPSNGFYGKLVGGNHQSQLLHEHSCPQGADRWAGSVAGT